MKILQLVFSRIRFYITSNVLIFVMFALGCIVCSVSFLYFYGNVVSAKRITGADEDSLKYYELALNQPLSFNDIKSNELLNSKEIDNVVLDTNLSMKDIPFLKDKNYNFENGGFVISTSLKNVSPVQMEGRTEFNKNEIESGANVVIIPGDTAFYNMKSGNKIILKEQEYEIVGMSISFFEFYITPKAFEKAGYEVNSIFFTFSKSVSEAENKEIIKKISQEFPSAKIVFSPADVYNSTKAKAPGEYTIIGVIFVISILSFMFLMKFMMDKSSFELITYSIVGASKKKTVLILLLTNVIISTGFAIIASLIHYMLYNSFFVKLNIYDNISYYINDYIFCGAAIILLSCLTSLPFVINTARSSIIRNKNKYNE